MAETAAELRAKQRANSLAEQRQQFLKTGRLTKGLARAGGGVEAQNHTVTTGESWFSIAASISGLSPNDPRVAAIAQQIANANGGLDILRSGKTLRIPGFSIADNARPTSAFMGAARQLSTNIGASAGSGTSTSVTSPVTIPSGSPTQATATSGSAYNPQAIQSLAGPQSAQDNSYNVQGIQSQMGVNMGPDLADRLSPLGPDKLIRDIIDSLNAPRGEFGVLGAQTSPTKPSSTPATSRRTTAPGFAKGYAEMQKQANETAKVYTEALSAAAETGTGYPTSISTATQSLMGFSNQDMLNAGYVDAGQVWVPSPDFLALMGGSEGVDGPAAGDWTSVGDYNRNRTNAIGIRMANRQSRGGVTASGSYSFYPDQVYYDGSTYGGGGGTLNGSWRIGF